MYTFLVTLTQPAGLTCLQMHKCETWFDSLKVKMIVSREQHKSGLWHVHCILEDSNKQAAGVKRKVKRALGKILDLSSHNSLNVKLVKLGQEVRTAGYVAKDGEVFVIRGWDVKTLLVQRAELLKKDIDRPPKRTFMLNEKNAEELILEYAHLHTMALTCKDEFCTVMADMAAEGYSVSRIKPTIVYAQVMARAGSPAHMRDWWQMKLGSQM